MQALLSGLHEAISPAGQSRKLEIAATPIASACCKKRGTEAHAGSGTLHWVFEFPWKRISTRVQSSAEEAVPQKVDSDSKTS
jgi:hypothetical protein